jgi:hypothetical protein
VGRRPRWRLVVAGGLIAPNVDAFPITVILNWPSGWLAAGLQE